MDGSSQLGNRMKGGGLKLESFAYQISARDAMSGHEPTSLISVSKIECVIHAG
jgi:hypothetical protein